MREEVETEKSLAQLKQFVIREMKSQGAKLDASKAELLYENTWN